MKDYQSKEIAFYVYLKLKDDKSSVWYEEEFSELTVANAVLFQNTLAEFIKLYAVEKGFNLENHTCDEYHAFLNESCVAIIHLWDSVYHEFYNCFTIEMVSFDPTYAIQNELGITVMHQLFSNIYKSKVNFESSLAEFATLLNDSEMDSEDWNKERDGLLCTIFENKGIQGVINRIKEVRVS